MLTRKQVQSEKALGFATEALFHIQVGVAVVVAAHLQPVRRPLQLDLLIHGRPVKVETVFRFQSPVPQPITQVVEVADQEPTLILFHRRLFVPRTRPLPAMVASAVVALEVNVLTLQ
jgi:hypothetical protein